MFCHTKQHRAIWDVALDVFCLCVEAFAVSPFLYWVGNCFDRDGDVFGILGSCS